MISLRLGLVGALLIATTLGSVAAHPPTVLTEAGAKIVSDEIRAFRKSIVEAIAAKDAAKLREFYAASFVHTHTSGKSDNRDARIVSALAGEPVIETSQVDNLLINAPNDWVAIAHGTSPVKSMADGKTYAVKWVAVYTRAETGWLLAASQATRAQ